MTTRPNRKQIYYRPGHMRPAQAPWHWGQHLPAALALLGAAAALWFMPADTAAAGSTPALGPDSTQFLQGGVTLFIIIAVLGVRGQPWWNTLTTTLIGLGESLLLARALQSPAPLPLGELLLTLGVAGSVLVQLSRPSVYERLDAATRHAETQRAQIAGLRHDLWRVGAQARHFEELYYATRRPPGHAPKESHDQPQP